MRRRLPPLNALRSFEAAARHESFTRAAEELFVTQGAVSQQVKALEAELGLRLFNRQRQRLVITAAGREYLDVVRDALDRLSAGTERLLSRQSSGHLTVSTSPDFAAKWLVHRLGRFHDAHPEIALRIAASAHQVDFAREDVDIAIRRGNGEWSGLQAERLAAERLFPVCSPTFLQDGRVASPEDVMRVAILRAFDDTSWTSWLAAAGLPSMPDSQGIALNSASMAIDAAINGQGIAMARTTLAAWDLLNHRLVRPFTLSLPVALPYWIVCPKAMSTLPKIVAFRHWMLAEAAQDERRLEAMGA